MSSANQEPPNTSTSSTSTPGTSTPDTSTSNTFSIDAFHKGGFYLAQPVHRGHRSGVDAMLLAALVDKSATGRLADLGAGSGAAAMAVAYRSCIDVVLVEAVLEMAEFAEQSRALPENIKFADRVSVLNADVELSGQARVHAGLLDNNFDHVIMNPPFNETGDRTTPDPLKARAHAISGDDFFEKWIKTAAAISKAQGQLSLIARPSSLGRIINACAGRFGGLEITNVQPRIDDAAIRILITGIKGSKARLSLRPSIILHPTMGPQSAESKYKDGKKSTYTELADGLINGKIFWQRGD
jgi:tRNA1(Val) A37 N6-methylase TrmN6